jgi:hypothetical protein
VVRAAYPRSVTRPMIVLFGSEERFADCFAAALGARGEGGRTPHFRHGCPPDLTALASIALIGLGLVPPTVGLAPVTPSPAEEAVLAAATIPAPPTVEAPGPADSRPEAPAATTSSASAPPPAGARELASPPPGALASAALVSTEQDRALHSEPAPGGNATRNLHRMGGIEISGPLVALTIVGLSTLVVEGDRRRRVGVT